ncbi:MAG: glycoside hydrolase family 16 protein [Bacteroidia bacterium]|nr:glycoside hydrolase family 16 protein [Bacteroidia bacterium]
MFIKNYKNILLPILIISANTVFAQKDSLNENKNPVKAVFFYRYLSLRDAAFKFVYNITKSSKDTFNSSINKKGYTLVFNDDFDSLDHKKWRIGQAWGEYIPGFQHQYFAKNAVQTSNGYLYLNTINESKQFKILDSMVTMPYGVGLINSDMSFMQKYGYFEIRSKNPSGPATWPAFWLTGAHRWPPEIDIFEMYGGKTGKGVHRQTYTVHWGRGGTKSRGYLTKHLNLPHNTDTAFHVYACDWSAKRIKFYTDGKLIRSQRVGKKLRQWLNDEMVVVINNGLEPKYLKNLPADFKSNSFVVDWVRVYKKNSSNK